MKKKLVCLLLSLLMLATMLPVSTVAETPTQEPPAVADPEADPKNDPADEPKGDPAPAADPIQMTVGEELKQEEEQQVEEQPGDDRQNEDQKDDQEGVPAVGSSDEINKEEEQEKEQEEEQQDGQLQEEVKEEEPEEQKEEGKEEEPEEQKEEADALKEEEKEEEQQTDAPAAYTVAFTVNEETFAVTVPAGESIGESMPAEPVLGDAYIFEGWFDENGNWVDAWTEVNAPMTVTARFMYLPAGSDSASAGGITVTAAWNAGVFPEGTQLTIDPRGRGKALAMAENALPEGYEAVDGEAVDITFIADGVSVQPYYGSVSVSISLNRILEGDSFRVLHEGASRRRMMKAAKAGGSGGSGNIETVSASASATGAAFSGSGFSVYAIVGETYQDNPTPQPRATYEFYVNGSKVDSQIVKTGDTLVEPSIPDCGTNQVFKGWKVQGKTGYVDFTAAVTVAGPDDETVRVDADFGTVYKVIFYVDESKSAIFQQVTAENEETVSTASYVLANTETARFDGWYLATDTTRTKVTSVEINGADVELLPLFVDGLWVYFDSLSGSYVEPLFTTEGSVSAPTAPTRAGYAFKGWYTSEEAAQNLTSSAKVTFPLSVTQSQTLFAGWEVIEVGYTVAIWTENADDDGYTLYGTQSRTALTGTPLTTNLFTSIQPYNGPAPCYDINTAKTDEAECTVAGDGSTVRNVYFTRHFYTVAFTNVSGQVVFTIPNVKYSENIYGELIQKMEEYKDQIPGNGWIYVPRNNYNNFDVTWKNLKRYGISISDGTAAEYNRDLLPHKNNVGHVLIRRINIGNLSTFITYSYWECLDDELTPENAEVIPYKGKNYYLKRSSTAVYSAVPWRRLNTLKGEAIELIGGYYRTDQSPVTIIDKGTYWMDSVYPGEINEFFKRNSKVLSFNEGGIGPYNVLYEKKLTEYEPEGYVIGTTTKEYEGGKTEVFQGWYDNQKCEGQPVDFSTARMPETALLLYAKWEPICFDVSFDLDGGTINGSSDYGPLTVESGDRISAADRPSDPIKEGYTFICWKDAEGNLFDFDTRITHIYYLKAVYHSDATYQVAYNPGTFGTFTGTDANSYSDGANAVVLSATPTVTDSTKVFLGWTIADPNSRGVGDLLLPGATFAIDKAKANESNVITLVAQYGSKPGLTTLTYEPNGGQGAAVTETDVSVNNGTTPAKDPADLGISPQTGYRFLYWTTNANGTGSKFRPGEFVALNNTDGQSNVLYAQYAAEVTVTVTGSTKTVKYDGTAQKNAEYTVTYKVAGETVASLPSGVTARITPDPVEAKGTDADTYTTTVTVTLSTASALYTVPADPATADVVLIVEPRTVTLTSETAEKVYDGTALTKPDVTVGGDGFVPDEVNAVNAIGTVTYVTEGEVTNAITYTEGAAFKAKNYTVTKTEGKLKITPAPLKITVKDQTYTYNGKAQGESNATYTSDFDKKVTVSGLVGGDRLTSVTLDGNEKKAGVYADRIKASGAAVGDLTANYAITYVPGKLTIKAKDDTPATGDTTNMIVWASLMLTSAIGCAGALLLAKGKKRRTAK